jgi:hypothetical protein
MNYHKLTGNCVRVNSTWSGGHILQENESNYFNTKKEFINAIVTNK